MYCIKCGTQLIEGAAFCTKCGAPAEKPVIPEPPVVEPVITEPVIEEPVIPEPPVVEPMIEAPVVPEPPVAAPVIEAPVIPEPPVEEPAIAEPKPKKHRRWKPAAPVRIVLRIASILLCLCLIGSLLATAVVLDMQRLTNQRNLEKVVDTLLQDDPAHSDLPLTLARKVTQRDSSGYKLTREQLIAWIYEVLKERGGEKMTVTEEQMTEFLDRSTADEYLNEKVSGFMADFINGTEKTRISKTEIIEVMEENEEIIEEVFGKKPDAKMKQDVLNFMEENDVEDLIHDEVFEKMEETPIISGKEGYTVGDLMEDLRELTSPATLIILILVDILLIVLLYLTNWFRLGSMLKCTGICLTVAGGLLSLPTVLLQFVPSVLSKLGSELLAGVISAIVSVMAPVHYTMFGLGIVTIIVAIVVKITTRLARE